ncbi:glycosyl hydrolase family 18 protein [Sphingosinicella sp. BN140058]|uniref:glycosyl hydrolase family 18 protein n=1 Tax=Sphingosinicella sp. BN140058 TaxID=1892855 RepID=UPI0010132CB2|nr:glycosyl hydrolase family 18 protein [Sphingosinicella sp. BN140058]QAY77872.1 glycosyl hydrolase family 18 [Sphingosinicella sp. BN140058]
MGGTWLARALLLAILPAATAGAAEPASRPLAVGYIPVFKGLERSIAKVDFADYTHLDLAFVNPDKDGRIFDGSRFTCAQNGTGGMLGADSVRSVAAKAHAAGSKLLISLGGGGIPACSGDWSVLLQPGSRDRIVAGLIAAVDRLGLDGIDVDIEGALLTKIDKEGNFTPFIAALSQALKARGKLLACATASYEGGMIPTASVPFFDIVGVMSYDAIGNSWGKAGDEHSTVEQARKDVQLWLDRGVPKRKLALGLPFYGYGYGRYRPNYNFRDIHAEYGGAALLTDVIGSRCSECSYITYNGPPTLAEKGRLAGEKAGGVMVWEVSQDTDDRLLIRTVNEAVRRAAE